MTTRATTAAAIIAALALSAPLLAAQATATKPATAAQTPATPPPSTLDGPAHPLQDPLLDQLVGSWTMSGTVRGRKVTYTTHAEWVLSHQFMKIDMRDVATPSSYEASFYLGYDNMSTRYVAHLLDVFGGRWSETLGYGQKDKDALTFVFEYPDGPFRTTFTQTPDGWNVDMRERAAGGEWRDFASYTLRKSK
jgi:hypothetical protein